MASGTNQGIWPFSQARTREHGAPVKWRWSAMLMRYDPFREIDRFTEGLFGNPARTPWMPMDAFRKGDHVEILFDLPGVRTDSIDLTVERNVLTVKAERS